MKITKEKRKKKKKRERSKRLESASKSNAVMQRKTLNGLANCYNFAHRSRNRRKKLAKLQGKGLGEASDEDESALSWIRKSRQREKELAEKRAREMAEMDETFERNGTTTATYGASDLSGLKVSHDLDEFNEGAEVILTLKDRGILEEEEAGDEDMVDELTNVQLEEKERLRKNLENKKKKPGYNPYDDEEFLLGGKPKSLLPQYDEEKKPEGFRIGAGGTVTVAKENDQSVSEKVKAQTLSYEKMQEIKDYYTQDEINLSFKKPKKKKKKDKLRKRVVDEESEPQPPPAVDTEPKDEQPQQKQDESAPPQPDIADANFVDDEDLQAALSRARRAANKQRAKQAKKMTPEEIARSIAEERDQDDGKEEEEESSGLVLSEMSEFVNSLGKTPVFAARESGRPRATSVPRSEATEESESQEPVRMESEEAEEQSGTASVATEKSARVEETTSQPPETTVDATPIIEEPLVSKGMAATLSLLSQKGIFLVS